MTSDLTLLHMVEEVMVSQRMVMEEAAEDQVIVHEARHDVGVSEVLIRHGVVVNFGLEVLINVELVGFNFLSCSVILAKSANLEDTVIEVGDTKLVPGTVLLDLLELDVVVNLVADLLLEGHFVGFKAVLLDHIGSVALFSDCNHRL